MLTLPIPGYFLQRGVKLHGTVQICLVGMSLGDAADEFEGAEGVEAEAAVLAGDLGAALGNGFGDLFFVYCSGNCSKNGAVFYSSVNSFSNFIPT